MKYSQLFYVLAICNRRWYHIYENNAGKYLLQREQGLLEFVAAGRCSWSRTLVAVAGQVQAVGVVEVVVGAAGTPALASSQE